MADDPNLEDQVAPPRQMPFKTVTQAQPEQAATKPSPISPAAPAASAAPAAPAPEAAAEPAAPRTVVLRRPTLRRPGEAPKAPISPLGTKPVILKPPVGGGAPAAQPLSMTDNIAKGIEIPRDEAAKKVTSRISVSSATAPIPPVTEGAAPAASPISLAKPPAKPAEPAPAGEKKVTSRISLESAFATQPEMPQQQPKTIKLKRPGEAAAPFTPVNPAPTPPAESPAPAPLPEGMTPISEAEGAAPEEPLTRRKTIKVKRPGGSTPSSVKMPTVRPDGVPSESDNLQSLSNYTVGAKPAAGPDKVNPIFIVAAVLAIVFTSLLIWVLTSQTYGERGAAGDYALPKGPSISPPPWLKTFD